MPLDLKDWHARYARQAGWTGGLRAWLYEHSGLLRHRKAGNGVLDVGCGTGVLSRELSEQYGLRAFGVDLNAENIGYAKVFAPQAHFTQADALHLPFPDGWFSACICHFLLLWLPEPLPALAEMRRVTSTGGVVLALAEPDYGGRLDYPPELAVLGQWQLASLRRQGADPCIGRRLLSLFRQAGLLEVRGGVLGAQWSEKVEPEELESEWQVLRADLEALEAEERPSPEKVDELYQAELRAWHTGERLIFTPTFYAWGRVGR